MKQQQTNKHYVPSRTLRSSGSSLLLVPRVRTGFGSRSFSIAAPIIWNSLVLIFETVLPYPVFASNLKPFTGQLFGLLSAPCHPQPSTSDSACQSPTLCALQIHLLTYLHVNLSYNSFVCIVASIELFQKMCDELKDWIGEKINGINLDDVGKDLASVKVLQRKQQNLEQELKPIEEKMNKMSMMANAYVCHLIFFIFWGAYIRCADNMNRNRWLLVCCQVGFTHCWLMPGFYHSVAVLLLPFRLSRQPLPFRSHTLLPLRIFLLFTAVTEWNFLT